MAGEDGCFFAPSSLWRERMKAVWADSANSHRRGELHLPEGFAQGKDVTYQKPIGQSYPCLRDQDGRDRRVSVREVK